MASPTRWTWVWASSARWWRTGKSGMLQSMRSQRVRHDRATEQQYYSPLFKAVMLVLFWILTPPSLPILIHQQVPSFLSPKLTLNSFTFLHIHTKLYPSHHFSPSRLTFWTSIVIGLPTSKVVPAIAFFSQQTDHITSFSMLRIFLTVSYCANIGEGNGTPVQYSCLENPMDWGAW